MNINGSWTGVITYGKEYREYENKELFFDAEIKQKENNFSGISTDTAGVGINSDNAILNGTVLNKEIEFLKQYDSYHYYQKGQTVIDRSRKGPIIQYKGIFDEEDDCFKGEWHIEMRYKLLFFIPLKYKCTGKWEMRRKENSHSSS